MKHWRTPYETLDSPYETLEDTGFTLQGFGTAAAAAHRPGFNWSVQPKADTWPEVVRFPKTPSFGSDFQVMHGS